MSAGDQFFTKFIELSYVPIRETEKVMVSSSFELFDDDNDEWSCTECFGPPPPIFNIPPPPCPPMIDETVWTCPSSIGAWDDIPTSTEKISIPVVIVTSATFVLLTIVAAIIVYKVRMRRRQSSKSNPPTEGTIIYDDLTQPGMRPMDLTVHRIPWGPLMEQFPPRYSQPPSLQRELIRYNDINMKLHSGPRTTPLAEPVYHTISSASAGSGSDPSDRTGSSSNASRIRYIISESDEEGDSLTPFLSGHHYNDKSPSEAKYYMSVPLGSIRPPSTTSSHEYETLPTITKCSTMGAPRNHRGLPPLPSRSERYRIFLSSERSRPNVPRQESNSTSFNNVLTPSSYL